MIVSFITTKIVQYDESCKPSPTVSFNHIEVKPLISTFPLGFLRYFCDICR